MKKSTLITVALILLVFAGILFFSPDEDKTPSIPSTEMDTFAQCISDAGATLYGAWWCPHCEEQLEMFGTSEQFLPYQECSLPSSRSQNLVCKKAGIQVYPTWKFADGPDVEGSLSFADISERTSCPLPAELTGEEPLEDETLTSSTTEPTETETEEMVSTSTELEAEADEATTTEEEAS